MAQDTVKYPVSTARQESTSTVIASATAAVTTVVGIDAVGFGFTAAQLAAADLVVISCMTNNCLVLWDGQNPTTTFGHPLTAGLTVLSFDGNAKINLLHVVSLTGTSNVTITLERY